MDLLSIKHRIMTSPLARPAKWLSALAAKPSEWQHPELRELFAEDRAMLDILPRLVARDAHCLDVGAHIGAFAYHLARLAPRGSLTMIEALPRKAAMLRRRFPQATVHEVAVSDAEGNTSFFENLDQSGFSSLADRASRGRTVEHQVALRRIDDLLADAWVDFMKVDVEGFEDAALRGAETLITRCRPAVIFEAGARGDAELEGHDGDAVFDLLADTHGYLIWSVAGFRRGELPLDQRGYRRCRTYPFTAFNFVALPPDHPAGPNLNEVPK